jgi:CHAT domain-containing protein
VFVVPDGELWRLNLDALPGPGESYLVEHAPQIRLIQDESCFGMTAGRSPARQGIAVVGGVDYDACGGADGGVDRPEYTALPYAGDEARVVADLWENRQPAGDSVVLLQGGDATESATRRALEEAGVVHLATHAFRLEREGVSATEAATWSGLALAGANHGGCAPVEDGVLTISELAHLDLRATELVFLSSCGSGLGVLLPGEGVLGFQRALRVAGCRASILSLWDLPDRPTRELVTAFYRNYLDGSSTPAQSLRAARTEILLSQRSHGRSTHPFNWGGLVAVTARE